MTLLFDNYCRLGDYRDRFSERFSRTSQIEVDDVSAVILRTLPNWLGQLMGVRNLIVRPFGLSGSGLGSFEESLKRSSQSVGDEIGPWKVIERNESEIVLHGVDKHLEFHCSLELAARQDEYELSFSTTVHIKNALGRRYFFFVRPFHRAIVQAMLRKIAAELAAIPVHSQANAAS